MWACLYESSSRFKLNGFLTLMKLIILDHDGVIDNDSNLVTKISSEWRPIPGSLEAIAHLNQAGYRVIVASNRSCDRKVLDMKAFNAMNDMMYKAVSQAGGRIDAIFFSPHINIEKLNCSRLLIMMFEEIAQRFGTDLKDVPTVGDELRYLQAAASVGAVPTMVLTGRGKKTRTAKSLPKNTRIFADLAAVADTLTK
jgi:D-glycero-D-manno-heptose 1,7-bisphosphate phosphatase